MTNLKLSNRLLKISSLIKNHDVIIDVGCDHALLDIYLTKNKIVKKAIATDITHGAIKMALKNVSYYDCLNVDVREGNGLDTLKKEDNVSLIIMSGLGNQKIVSILKDNKEKLHNIRELIIQSNTGYFELRKEIVKLGYIIEDEVLVKENNIIYVIIKFNKGQKKYNNKQLYFGPILLKNKNTLFRELVSKDIHKNKLILDNLPSKKVFKKLKIRLKIRKLKKEIKGL